MKKTLRLALCLYTLSGPLLAQTYLPIATTNFNLDAVAENTTALSTTGGAIDGSNYVLYSAAYGGIVGGGTTYGLPNNGLIANGTRTYQLQSYTANNMLYLPALQSDTLLFTNPAQYPSLSVLGFATEGTGVMTLKVRFSDGTSQTFSSLTLDDWFATGPTNTVIIGIDRCSRISGTPGYNGSNPRMFRIDLNLSCANRLKNVQKLVVQNNSTNPRLCVMAVSGGISATYSVNTSPVTCIGGTNGSASLTVSNGVPPFTYSWSTSPMQNTTIVNLPVGITNYTVSDATNCTYTSSVNIALNIIPALPLTIAASQNPVCAGSNISLTTNGASTYTWSNNGSTNTTTVSVGTTTQYSVVATTSANCTLTGNITVTANPLPVLTFTTVPAKLCLNTPGILLSANPSGGTFNGPGISFGSFFPNLAGLGTQTISYSYADANNCAAVTTISTTISSPTTVIAFVISPAIFCTNAPNINLNATPAGGVYAGQGIIGSVLSPSLAGAGIFTVSYTYSDANNCNASKVTSVIINTCSTVGMKELNGDLHYQLFPNPSNGSFIVKADRDLELMMMNDLGQTVQNLKLDANQQISIENMPAGIYFLRSTDHTINHKIVVTK